MGVFAQAVAHIGLSGQPDHVVWAFALRHEMAVVTTNAADFLELLDVELHPGLILLRESGLNRQEQWLRLEPAVRYVQSQPDPDYLVNKVLEVVGPGQLHLLDTSESQS